MLHVIEVNSSDKVILIEDDANIKVRLGLFEKYHDISEYWYEKLIKEPTNQEYIKSAMNEYIQGLNNKIDRIKSAMA